MSKRVRLAFAVLGIGVAVLLIVLYVGPNATENQSSTVAGADANDAAGQAGSTGPSASGSATPESSSDPADWSAACRLLTAKELDQALGGVSTISPDVSDETCLWDVTGSDLLGKEGTAEVSFWAAEDADGEAFSAHEKEEIAAGRSKDVRGIGDDAYYTAASNTLSFRVEQKEVSIQLLGF